MNPTNCILETTQDGSIQVIGCFENPTAARSYCIGRATRLEIESRPEDIPETERVEISQEFPQGSTDDFTTINVVERRYEVVPAGYFTQAHDVLISEKVLGAFSICPGVDVVSSTRYRTIDRQSKALEKSCIAMENKCSEYEHMMNKLKVDVHTLDRQLGDTNTELLELMIEVETHQVCASEMKKRMANLELEIARITAENEKLFLENEDLSRENEALLGDNENLESQLRHHEAERASVSQWMSTNASTIARLEQKIERLKAKQNKLGSDPRPPMPIHPRNDAGTAQVQHNLDALMQEIRQVMQSRRRACEPDVQ